MKETLRRVVQIRAGGRTERCHGITHLGSYSNAAHQWGVAMLMHALWPDDFPRLVLHCLTHDVPEGWVGDIPAPSKRYGKFRAPVAEMEDRIQVDLGLPTESSLDPLDAEKLKNCDQLELWFWCQEQLLLGNKFVREVINELEQFWSETPLLPEVNDLRASATWHGVAPRMSGVVRKLMENQDVGE